MRIACLCSNQARNQCDNHWVTARSEGRHMINAGFGFGEMGYEVGIFCNEFTTTMNVYKNVSLYHEWDLTNHYDLVVTYNPHNGYFGAGTARNNYSKIFYVHYGAMPEDIPQEALLARHPKIVAILSVGYYGDALQAGSKGVGFPKKVPFEYFPIPHPITCYDKIVKQDFQDFHFDKTKKKLRIWIIASSWFAFDGQFIPDEKVVEILKVLRDDLNYEIDLTVTVSSLASDSHPIFVKEFNANVIENYSYTYKGVLDRLMETDLCIVKGSAGHRGSGMLDIVSLGVPFLYITDEIVLNPLNPNEITKKCIDDCILLSDTREVLVSKVVKQMADLQPSVERMRNAYIEYSFPVWSKIAEAMLKKYGLI